MACAIVGVSRSGFYRRRQEPRDNVRPEPEIDKEISDQIQQVIKAHPTYGYRMVWAVLRFDRLILVNKKKVQRIMKLKRWQAQPMQRPKRYAGEVDKRRRKVVDPKAKIGVAYPDLRWSTDLTKFYVEEAGWVNLIPVIDCCSRECLGYRLSVRGRAREARDALEDAVLRRFGDIEAVPEGLSMRMDNGGIFLAREYWNELKRLDIQPEFTPYRCPSANGIVERFIKTFKEECAWQHQFKTFREAEEVIKRWIEFYNTQRRHSSLSYMTPAEYRESLRKKVA